MRMLGYFEELSFSLEQRVFVLNAKNFTGLCCPVREVLHIFPTSYHTKLYFNYYINVVSLELHFSLKYLCLTHGYEDVTSNSKYSPNT